MRIGATIACGVLSVAGSSCFAQETLDSAWSLRDASDVASDAPVVGRLQYQDRVVDLTVDAFADGPNGAAVDPSSYAKVMADIDVRGSKGDRAPRGIGDDRLSRDQPDESLFTPQLDFRGRR